MHEFTSAFSPSNHITIGSIIPPYNKNFLDYSDITGYTIIDANGDERTWDTSYSGVQISYSYSGALDDWLITPAIKLYKDKIYTFTVEAQNNSTNTGNASKCAWVKSQQPMQCHKQ